MLDQTPRLLFYFVTQFCVASIRERLLFESGVYFKHSGIGKIFCKCKGFEKSQFYKINKELRYGDLVLKQNFQLLDQLSLSYNAVPTQHLQFVRRARAVDAQQRYSNISRGYIAFESGDYFVQLIRTCGDNSRAATNRERRMIERIRYTNLYIAYIKF